MFSLINRKMRSSSVEEVGGHGPGDPWEVFTALAILVVEGRTPGGERGYHAGPHCPLPHQLQHKHSCDPNHHVVSYSPPTPHSTHPLHYLTPPHKQTLIFLYVYRSGAIFLCIQCVIKLFLELLES